jgi:tRNA 2-thiouridine synthesizing protein A
MSRESAREHFLDCTGSVCPEPVLRTREAIAELSAGDILEVMATDPLAELDLSVFCEHAGHELLSTQTVDGTLRARIRVSSGRRPGAG